MTQTRSRAEEMELRAKLDAAALAARQLERERIIEAIRDRARALSAEAWASQQAQTLRDLAQQAAALEQFARFLSEEVLRAQ